jgi:gliding motility-associated-like protein
VSYLWNDNATTEDRAGLSVGSYSVTATSGICTATATFTITQSGSVTVTLQPQDAVCFGTASGEILATVTGGSQPYSYTWSSGQTSNPITALSAGGYSVTAVDVIGCSGSASAIVSEPAPISVDVNPDTLLLPLGGTGQVIVTSQNAANPVYSWSPSFALSCFDCTNPIVSTTQSGQFVVTVSENIGNVSCQANATLVVIVEPHKPIFIPNSFSPNGDGNNDVFQIFGEGIKFFELKIFNRWGEKIYESNNHLQGWDGTYKGKPQEPQVLVYLIDVVYLDDYTDHKMGSLTIIK